MPEVIFLTRKKINKKNMCANPTQNFQTRYQKHTYLFIWPNEGWKSQKKLVWIANREDPDQTDCSLVWVWAVCLYLFGRELVFKF